MTPAPTCPRCGSVDTIQIVYGLVGWEVGEAADRGEVVIGGCLISDDSASHHCKACGWEFKA